MGGVITSPGAELTLTMTDPCCCPDEAGGVGVGVCVGGGVVVGGAVVVVVGAVEPPPCTPTVAVTVAVVDVRNMVVARPL